MPDFCRLTLAVALANCLAARPATAQPTAPAAGRLRYESTRRVDMDKVKIMMLDPNGQEIKPGALGSSVELPSSISAEQSLLYSGHYAKEERSAHFQLAGGNINMVPGANGATRRPVPPAPPAEAQYFDLPARTATTVATIGGTDYVVPTVPVPAPPPGWHDLPQTRKIAGYLCHKATVPFKKETYTLWVTTELPFSYSPVRELTPAQGVVLALSSEQEEYLATKLTPEPVAEAAVRPNPQARPVTEAELKELRAKAQADLRQRLMEQYARPAAH